MPVACRGGVIEDLAKSGRWSEYPQGSDRVWLQGRSLKLRMWQWGVFVDSCLYTLNFRM